VSPTAVPAEPRAAADSAPPFATEVRPASTAPASGPQGGEGPDAATTPTILYVDDITVSFDGFKALTNLTLTFAKGELRCLIGPNGAGKTTLMDVVTGKTRPDSGSVRLHGVTEDLVSLPEFEIARLGIGRKFQRPTVFQGHTVLENLELACKSNKGVWSSLFGRQRPEERRRIDDILGQIGLGDQRDRLAALLAHGHKQWLEIGMLLAQDPQVLLLDEPIAGMTHEETERTAELVQQLAGDRTVIVVEHDMEFVRHIARKVTVLHQGQVLAEGSMEEVQKHPRVIEVYLGTQVES
jgi:urea transport system ATP-binding protein